MEFTVWLRVEAVCLLGLVVLEGFSLLAFRFKAQGSRLQDKAISSLGRVSAPAILPCRELRAFRKPAVAQFTCGQYTKTKLF